MIYCLHRQTSDRPTFRILCVDEDAAFLRVLKLVFDRHGMEVITASPGIDAVMQFQAQKGRFAAILIDHDSFAADSLDFVRQVREQGYQGRILIMSGGMPTPILKQYFDYGIGGFFSKPFDIGMVATLLLQEK